MEEVMTLKEWTIHFVKNKDLIVKKLVNYTESEESVLFHFQDKDHEYLIVNDLDDSVISFVNREGLKSVVCNASKDNLNFLLEQWNVFSKSENLTIIFVRINANKRWIINPFIHDKICDHDSFELGIKSMYENAF